MEANTVFLPNSNTALECESGVEKKLLIDLKKQTDIVLDFSSLKNCLNPMGIEEQLDKQEQKQVIFILS